MFGMGLTEIILILIVGVIALGPEKLPDAMVSMAKIFNKLKDLLGDAKDTLDEQIHLDELNAGVDNISKSIAHTRDEIIKTSGVKKANEEMDKINEMMAIEDEIDDDVGDEVDEALAKKKKKKKKKKNKKKDDDV